MVTEFSNILPKLSLYLSIKSISSRNISSIQDFFDLSVPYVLVPMLFQYDFINIWVHFCQSRLGLLISRSLDQRRKDTHRDVST